MHSRLAAVLRLVPLGLLACAASVRAAEARFPFVIPGDDATATVTSLAALSPRPAGADGFVRIRDTHFFTDAGRLRFWGINTCFAGNFPAHADAEKVAAHLAKLGLNAVRMHHHDTSPAPRGILGTRRRRPPHPRAPRNWSEGLLPQRNSTATASTRISISTSAASSPPRKVSAARASRTPRGTTNICSTSRRRPKPRLKEFCRDYLLHQKSLSPTPPRRRPRHRADRDHQRKLVQQIRARHRRRVPRAAPRRIQTAVERVARPALRRHRHPAKARGAPATNRSARPSPIRGGVANRPRVRGASSKPRPPCAPRPSGSPAREAISRPPPRAAGHVRPDLMAQEIQFPNTEDASPARSTR
jgi:hypothetical protein